MRRPIPWADLAPDIVAGVLVLTAWALGSVALAAYFDSRVWWISGAVLAGGLALLCYGVRPAWAALHSGWLEGLIKAIRGEDEEG